MSKSNVLISYEHEGKIVLIDLKNVIVFNITKEHVNDNLFSSTTDYFFTEEITVTLKSTDMEFLEL